MRTMSPARAKLLRTSGGARQGAVGCGWASVELKELCELERCEGGVGGDVWLGFGWDVRLFNV